MATTVVAWVTAAGATSTAGTSGTCRSRRSSAMKSGPGSSMGENMGMVTGRTIPGCSGPSDGPGGVMTGREPSTQGRPFPYWPPFCTKLRTKSSALVSSTSSISSRRSSSSALSWSPFSEPAGTSSTSTSVRSVLGLRICSRSAMGLSSLHCSSVHEPSLSRRSADVSLSLINLPTWASVPRDGSIIGARRSSSVPVSNTSESQLAATTSSAYTNTDAK